MLLVVFGKGDAVLMKQQKATRQVGGLKRFPMLYQSFYYCILRTCSQCRSSRFIGSFCFEISSQIRTVEGLK